MRSSSFPSRYVTNTSTNDIIETTQSMRFKVNFKFIVA